MRRQPNYIRARQHTTTYDRFMHARCYFKAYAKRQTGKGTWVNMMVNNYLSGKVCELCDKPLQCACSPFVVTQPDKDKCNACQEKKSYTKTVPQHCREDS